MSTIDTLKDSVKTIISTVLAEEPFFGLLLKRTWIIANDNVPTAMTDGVKIYVNPAFFSKLAPEERKAILLHELMHIVQLHPTRSKKYISRGVPHVIVNLVADAKANQYIEKYVKKLRTVAPILPSAIEEMFNIKDAVKKSFEEIMDEILKQQPQSQCECRLREGDGPRIPVDVQPNNTGGGGGEEGESGLNGEPLNEGDNEDRGKKSPEEIERQIQKKLLESAMVAKQIGKLPAELERLVEELAKPKVHWKRLIRSTLSKGLGKSVKRTWNRPSRKIPNSYPGKETLKLGKVVVLVDTSGSIGQKELKQFVGEIYGIVKEVAEVIVIPWDAQAYSPIVIKSHRDIEKVRVLKGGGGTIIKPALELVDKKYSDAQQIVILSDWYIGDLDDQETQRLLKKYADRIIAVTTSAGPPSYLPVRVKIDLSE
jgi:predicted metal-dependent peptidase